MMPQTQYRQKALIVERLVFEKWEPILEGAEPIVPIEPGFTEYRVGYYVVSPKRNNGGGVSPHRSYQQKIGMS
jgi:hypothetical protein